MIRLLAFLAMTCMLMAHAPTVNKTDEAAYNYIDMYRDLAVVEMYRSGIPASITLAQGMHESGMGNSALATQANNHFGIKCKAEWTGRTYKHKDDDYNAQGQLIKSCFRAYDSAMDSYIDHSNFLMERSFYTSLFQYHHTEYKKWAHGLKKCGYATDKKYAEKLIRYIEKYDLHQYDTWDSPFNYRLK